MTRWFWSGASTSPTSSPRKVRRRLSCSRKRVSQRRFAEAPLQRLQQFGQFFTRAVVVLCDGEFERVFQNWFGFHRMTKGDQRFAELNMRDHPFRFLHAERTEMFDSGGVVVRIDVGLRQVKAGEIVIGKSLPQFERLVDSGVTHGVLLR